MGGGEGVSATRVVIFNMSASLKRVRNNSNMSLFNVLPHHTDCIVDIH